MTITYHHSATFNDLARLLTGKLFLPQAADYEQGEHPMNGRNISTWRQTRDYTVSLKKSICQNWMLPI